VDPVSRRDFWGLIRELAGEGTTVFVTTHYLDEAEYCRRIGLMADGKLVALDTPAALKKAWVPDRVFLVRGRQLPMARLRAEAGIQAVEPFGAALHVRGDPARWDAEGLARRLREAGGLEVAVDQVEPSLEDVFLAAVGGEKEAVR
jgi:ABC-2 type transport system ATP-binding protein